MLLDAATLRDLEIRSPLTPQGPTLWSLVDLREGVSTQRLGMTLLRQEQVLDLLGDVVDAGAS